MTPELFRFLSLSVFPVIIIGAGVMFLQYSQKNRKRKNNLLHTNNTHMITIYTRWFCPYCSAAKRTLEEMWLEYKELNLERGSSEAEQLLEISGMTTVPQIFSWEICKANLIGGYDDMLAKIKAGEIFQ